MNENKNTIRLTIEGKPKDLGGFTVRRVLPSPKQKMVGPFIFWDHMGPSDFSEGQGIDVRPHPHIGLSTLTYLFEGEILHRDSLGFVQLIRPGAVNWMTAGQGIVHSERTSDELRKKNFRLHGIQSWIALPIEDEECEPSFHHIKATDLPTLEKENYTATLVAGSAFGVRSPVPVHSPLFYLDVQAEPGAQVELPQEYEDRAMYIVEGEAQVTNQTIKEGMMVILEEENQANIRVTKNSRLILLGGDKLKGTRHIWWNLVSSDFNRIEHAKEKWKNGKFDPVPEETEFIPLPES